MYCHVCAMPCSAIYLLIFLAMKNLFEKNFAHYLFLSNLYAKLKLQNKLFKILVYFMVSTRTGYAYMKPIHADPFSNKGDVRNMA